MDSVPIVCITGQVFSTLMGTDAFQEADIVGITMPITKHSFLVKDASEIPGAIARLAAAPLRALRVVEQRVCDQRDVLHPRPRRSPGRLARPALAGGILHRPGRPGLQVHRCRAEEGVVGSRRHPLGAIECPRDILEAAQVSHARRSGGAEHIHVRPHALSELQRLASFASLLA